MKICTKCKQQKAEEFFPTRLSSSDGLDSWCKACVKFYAQQRRQIKNNVSVERKTCTTCRKEKHHSKFGRMSSSKDGLRGECKSCRNLKSRMRYARDPEFRLSESIRHNKIYQKNKDVILTRTNKWSSENKEKKVEQAQRRRARKTGQIIFDLPENYLAILCKQQSHICAYCGCDVSLHPTTDHLIPLSRGGKHSIDNIKIACTSCNSSKNDKTLIEWLNLNRAILKNESSEKLETICQSILDLIALYPDKAGVEV